MRKNKVIKQTKFLLDLISKKKLKKLLFLPKFSAKMGLFKFYQPAVKGNYVNYSFLINRIFKALFVSGSIIGIGHTNYYSLDFSKKNKSLSKKKYLNKLNVKKESWFFYGICISKKNKMLASTVKLWNVYYNEIIEKTFLLFNPRNSVLETLKPTLLINASKYDGHSLKKKWFFLRKKPRQYSKITLR